MTRFMRSSLCTMTRFMSCDLEITHSNPERKKKKNSFSACRGKDAYNYSSQTPLGGNLVQ